MSCGCKAKKNDGTPFNVSSPNNENTPKKSIGVNIIHYSIKLLGFGIALALSPFLMLVIIYYMFNMIVMTKDVDIRPIFISASKFMKKVGKDNTDEDDEEDDEEDDAEWENINPDEFELIGVDDLTKK
jgi:hypothetical protein